MKKITFYLIFVLIQGLYFSNCFAEQDLQVLMPDGKAKLTYQVTGVNEVMVSALDAENNPVRGLKPGHFVIEQKGKKAKIVSVESLEAVEKVSLNIVLVVDNSLSMKDRGAVEPLISALEEFFKIVRPIDNVHVVVFDDNPGLKVGERHLHAKTFLSKNVPELRKFLTDSFKRGLTGGTYLYEAMLAGIDLIRQMPANSNKFLLVLTDGEDLNSGINKSVVESEAKGIMNFEAYAIDYMPRVMMDPFLKSFAEVHSGHIWKATSATNFVPIFKSFSTNLLHRYLITYKFFDPPKGTVAMKPTVLTVEELTTIDTSPMLNYVFFDTGKSDLPEAYHLFTNQADTKAFSEMNLRGTKEKYYNTLNIIGKRLVEFPEAHVRIVGCNSNYGEEQGRTDLSRSRAEAVRAYLMYIWGIESSRMKVEARNLPFAATTNRSIEGRLENQRVEIYSDFPAILDPIKSTYVEEMSEANEFRIFPKIQSGYGIARWKIELNGDGVLIGSVEGEGDLKPVYTVDIDDIGLEKVRSFKEIAVGIEVTDEEGQVYKDGAVATCSVKFVKKEERVAQKMGYKVLEKYALILFDFNSSIVKERNRAIVDRIVERMKAFPTAEVKVVGHTDNLGEVDYNLWLSERRAKAVYEQVLAGGMTAGEKITYAGAGPHDPLYDNNLPEGRALNRTVTVHLEYERNEYRASRAYTPGSPERVEQPL
ncbi:MAG: OmpA family protein [Desulfobacteraceae bacterium]|jgi:outer membrane protein OmpA-like peptidoglycan-associated protein